MKSLVELDLQDTDVVALPQTIGGLVKLEVLSVNGCRKIKEIPVSIGDLKSLIQLDISYSGITELPDLVGNLEKLRVMRMKRSKLKELPTSIGMLKKLEELDAWWSELLERIPSTIEGLTFFRVINLKQTLAMRELPPKLPAGLTDVRISSRSLQVISDFSSCRSLARLSLADYGNESRQLQPAKLQGMGKLYNLVKLKLELWNVTFIPEDFSSLPQLKELTLRCPNLQSLPPLPSSLLRFRLGNLREETELPRLSNLKDLLSLEFQGFCMRDDSIRELGVGELESLGILSLEKCTFRNLNGLHLPKYLHGLHISDCKSLEALTSLSHLNNLTVLTIEAAENLVEIIGLGELECLRLLTIRFCGSLERIQNLSKLKSLEGIQIWDCGKFRGIDGICELKSLEHLEIRNCKCKNQIVAQL